jgi:hypothetical protein
MPTEQTMERAEDCAADICHELNIDDNEFNICSIADQITKHFPSSVPVVQPEKLEHVHILAKQVLITGDPQELPEAADDNDPRQHNCDAMGCPTLDHILYRLPFTDHREPIDIKAFAKTLAECIDFTAGPVQARELFEKKLKALIAEAK